MGRKVHPIIFRLGQTTEWGLKWFADKKDFASRLRADTTAKKFLAGKLSNSGLDFIEIERFANKVRINVSSAKPGVIIGRGGEGIEKLKAELKAVAYTPETVLELNVKEAKNASLSAGVIAEGIVADLEKRMPFRKIMKRSIEQVKKAGAKGIKVIVGGRLNGAEIARSEALSWGKVPLHTFRADIDYRSLTARTIYGAIGVKVWIYRGDIFPTKETARAATQANNKD